MLILQDHGNIKDWYKDNNQDTMSFYNVNDFELALLDFGILDRASRYKEYLTDLNWFIFERPSLYLGSLDAYASYLTYVIVVQFLSDNRQDIGYYETYFTNQLVNFLESKRDFKNMLNLSYIVDLWNKAFSIISFITNIAKSYSNFVPNPSVYFNSSGFNFKLSFPFLGLTKDSVEPLLLLAYNKKKPSWYSVPALYKIYKYYADQGIPITNVRLMWLDTSNFTGKPIVEEIPLTDNVVELVSRYSSVDIFPYKNIFNKSSSCYYNKTPLNSILK